MVIEIVIRFVVGGLVVCAFAVLGDVLRPKGLAGIFGAAPSVALATLGLTFMSHGGAYVGLEGRSMVVGAIALLLYSLLVGWLLMERKLSALTAACTSAAVWLAAAFSLWGALLR